MSQLIIDSLDPQILAGLQARASKHNRSLQEELKAILQQVIEPEITPSQAQMAAFREQAAQIRQNLSGQVHTDSAQLIREERDR